MCHKAGVPRRLAVRHEPRRLFLPKPGWLLSTRGLRFQMHACAVSNESRSFALMRSFPCSISSPWLTGRRAGAHHPTHLRKRQTWTC